MFLPLLISLFLHAPADTLTVPSARMQGPYTIPTPYFTDSVGIKGKTFDAQEMMERNAALALRRNDAAATTTVSAGQSLTVGADSLPALRLLTFTLEASRFTKARINVDGAKTHKLFRDGHAMQGTELQLTPGRTTIALQLLTTKGAADRFDVRITGDDLSALSVNPEGKRPYTMTDMLCGPHYRSAQLSPSGRYLVTTLYNLRADDWKAPYEVSITDMQSGRAVWHRDEYLNLSWLPSGERDALYYTRNGARGKELVLLTPADGRETVLATELPEGGFRISPKADYLIFSQGEDDKQFHNGLQFMENPDDQQPGWRNRNALWRYDLATGLFTRLTFGKTGAWLADISADGRSLLIQYGRFDATRQPFDRSTFVRMDAYTGRVDTLLADTTFLATAKFSPDGRSLLVKASPAAFGGIGCETRSDQVPNAFDYRLYLYDIAARTVKPLLPRFAPAVENFLWAPGDGQIYFDTTDGQNASVFRLNPQTLERTRFELPLTNIHLFSIATASKRSPRIVFFGQTGERAREMFTATLDKAKPAAHRIGSINFDELYKDVAIGTSHDYRFRATRGDTIDGYFFLPPSFDATKKYPLIVYYYGGCTPSTRSLEYQYPCQVFAAQGYVVYVVNPSGAIGYGQEFAARHVGTWGNESGDDILEGTRSFLKDHPYVDSTKVGCIGASYGGFMTEYLQTRTDLFAAAVSHAGISNIASYWGGGYWGYSYGESAQYGSYPWNNPQLYMGQSALFNADKIHTPLLLLHGTVDTNVPTSESQQLYTALKILGRDVAFVRVEGENHVIRDYAKRLAWQNAIFAWFAKYLKGEPAWWESLKQ